MKSTNKIQTLTVRFSSNLYDKICSEAEDRKITNAEAIRLIVHHYFTSQDEATRLGTLQANILSAVKEVEQNLSQQISNLVEG